MKKPGKSTVVYKTIPLSSISMTDLVYWAGRGAILVSFNGPGAKSVCVWMPCLGYHLQENVAMPSQGISSYLFCNSN